MEKDCGRSYTFYSLIWEIDSELTPHRYTTSTNYSFQLLVNPGRQEVHPSLDPEKINSGTGNQVIVGWDRCYLSLRTPGDTVCLVKCGLPSHHFSRFNRIILTVYERREHPLCVRTTKECLDDSEFTE